MSRVQIYRARDLRSRLRELRTDIAMAVDDPFPLVHGLADRNIISDQLLKDTVEREGKEGVHRAMYCLVSWVLRQSRDTLRAFWSSLTKDYNLESYPKLHTLFMAEPERENVGKYRCVKRSTEASREHSNKKRTGEERTMTTNTNYFEKTSKKKNDSKLKSHKSKSVIVQRASAQPAKGGRLMTDHRTVPPFSLCSSSSVSCVPESQEAVNETLYAATTLVHHTGATNTNTEPHRNDDECAVCKDGGELICCDGCPRAFHLTCLQPALTSIPSGTWKCQCCHGNRMKSRPGNAPLQCSGGGDSDVCAVCLQAGGQLSQCARCLRCYHVPCHFNKDSSVCRSCILLSNRRSEDMLGSRAAGLQVIQPVDVQSYSFLDSIIQKEEMDPILGEESMDGLLQWAFHSVSMPLPDTQGPYQLAVDTSCLPDSQKPYQLTVETGRPLLDTQGPYQLAVECRCLPASQGPFQLAVDGRCLPDSQGPYQLALDTSRPLPDTQGPYQLALDTSRPLPDTQGPYQLALDTSRPLPDTQGPYQLALDSRRLLDSQVPFRVDASNTLPGLENNNSVIQ